MRAYDPRFYPWARCRRDRQKMAGKPIYTIDAIAERRAVRALIRKLAGLPGEASRCPLYPRKQTSSDATDSVRQRVAVRVFAAFASRPRETGLSVAFSSVTSEFPHTQTVLWVHLWLGAGL